MIVLYVPESELPQGTGRSSILNGQRYGITFNVTTNRIVAAQFFERLRCGPETHVILCDGIGLQNTMLQYPVGCIAGRRYGKKFWLETRDVCRFPSGQRKPEFGCDGLYATPGAIGLPVGGITGGNGRLVHSGTSFLPARKRIA